MTLSKNGHDQAQDRDIVALREQNGEEHKEIGVRIASIEKKFETFIERQLGRDRTVVVAWVIIVALGGALMTLGNQQLQGVAETVEKTTDVLHKVEVRHEAWEARAIEWGNQLGKRDDHIEEEIKELRRNMRKKERNYE